MKTLIIPRVDLFTMAPRYAWMSDESVSMEIMQRLIDAGFNILQAIYADKDEEGNRRYRQLEPGEEVADLG